MVGYQAVKENSRYVQPFCHTAGVWRTDRQTGRHLAKHKPRYT